MGLHRIMPCSAVFFLCLAEIMPGLAWAETPRFRDPLDVPAEITARASTSMMLAVAAAGDRLVAVGELGRIVLSNDNGRSWTQVASPVSTTLVAVQFPTWRDGWAVGHGGVILHTADGGQTWIRQLDGRSSEALLRKHYGRLRDAGDAKATRILEAMDLNYQNGPELPLLGVWFRTAQEGFAVGAFGMVLATRDGGNNWEPWLDRIDQVDDLHLTAVAGIGDRVFITGEMGRIWRLDTNAGRFVPCTTPYEGTLFGITGQGERLIAFGLRGNAVLSTDGGERWTGLDLPAQGDSINNATSLGNDKLALVTQGGRLLIGGIDGTGFAVQPVRTPTLLTSVVPAGADTVVVTGLSGVWREPIVQNNVRR
ncbi:glycosyl hydrolase (plasmid) [Azospirillum sp. B510]|uniref:WD40/YVTN/BNR-like repeat-containing protein n=1 Tax=Azospirillum sp. (strain B510) TaxID=137722 RepID=UPI0001C4CB97|nr:glycosyl hydrolase [Azospirillum sp. B510]BAI74840.1 glycosyl hydrolase [Azospirillum sp. B510]